MANTSHEQDLLRQKEASVKYFLAIPWTASYLKKPNVCHFITPSRYRKDSNEDALFGSTLNTPDTIANCITIYDKPSKGAVEIPIIRTLFTVGVALDGWPKVLHGGVVATLLDETMGILIGVHQAHYRANPELKNAPDRVMSTLGPGAFTATLNIAYKAKMRTPKPVVVEARYVKREGRKEWIYAEARQWDDESGKEVVCATGEALFIAQKASL